MKSIYYQILNVMAEFYPGWVVYLNKNSEQKRLTLAGYRRVISEDFPAEVVKNLADWLGGSQNRDYRKWPPSALELKVILNMLLKRRETNVLLGSNSSRADPDLSLHRLASLLTVRHQNLFNDKNQHLQPYALKIADCLMNNRPLYQSAIYFVEIFSELRKTHTLRSGFEKMLHINNRDVLLSKIGPVDIDVLMRFLWETHWHPEIFEILDSKYRSTV